MTVRAMLGLWALMGMGWSWMHTTQSLEPSLMILSSISDSGSYLVYDYVVHNPSGSRGGVAEVRLAVDAVDGTSGSVLPATGPFLNGPSFTSGIPVTPYVDVGPISPADWQASLSRDAELAWYGVNGRDIDVDSIAPGDRLSGLGIRSSYLPGLREVRVTPTLQACCSEPWGTEETNPDRIHPRPGDSAVGSLSVGPTYHPSTMHPDTLASLLARVCTTPLWIDDPALCRDISDSLDAAASRLAANDYEGASSALHGMELVLEHERMPSGPVEDNAYWMLKTSSEHLRRSWPDPPVALVVRREE